MLLCVVGALGVTATPDLGEGRLLYYLLVPPLIPPALLLLVRDRDRERAMVAPTALCVLLGVWLLWAPLSLRWSPDQVTGAVKTAHITLALASAFCVLGLAGGRWDSSGALRTGWLLGFGVTSAVAGWELTTQRHLIDGPWMLAGNHALTSTFYNPNNYAAFLLACLPYLVWGTVTARRWASRQAHLVLLVVWIGLVIATKSRTGLLGGLAAAPLVAVWLGRSPALRRSPLAVQLLYTAVGAGLLLWLVAGTPIGQRLVLSYQSPFHPDRATLESDGVRVNLTRLGWDAFLESRLLGEGAGAFEVIAGQSGVAALGGLVNAHNGFIEVAAEFGLPVLLPLLGVIVAAGWTVFAVRVPRHLRAAAFDLRMVILLSLTAMLAASLAASSILSWPWWWLLVGQLAVLSWRLQAMGRSTTGQRAGRRPVVQRAGQRPAGRRRAESGERAGQRPAGRRRAESGERADQRPAGQRAIPLPYPSAVGRPSPW
ncbi:O-antigen ligase family protein [Micromonospora cathayae]|uniref:O-antigen ligase family protein n=1 Tax=Micromonospora cathayae TaxID=3028804 RepID=A0ABY7ZY87_9ACTN|nr:O-antigen ligase family protein [Micromonospora sp. HUAS 3]WDZ87868.1 O-antigen ligase family protein [Micromonospora sp. HUAS 3]